MLVSRPSGLAVRAVLVLVAALIPGFSRGRMIPASPSGSNGHIFRARASAPPHGGLPVFVQFKKCGTGAASQSLFNHFCAPISPDPMCDHFYSIAAQNGRGSSLEEERVLRITMGSAPTKANLPSRQLRTCVDEGKLQLYTIIRDPLTRVISSLDFWGGHDLATMHPVKMLLSKTAAENVTVELVNKARKCVWAGCFYYGNFNPSPVATISSTLLGTEPVPTRWSWLYLNYTKCAQNAACGQKTHALPAEVMHERVLAAIRNLRRDWVVGVTERMTDFLIHATLNLGMDPRYICEQHTHLQTRTRRGRALLSTSEAMNQWPAATLDYINSTVQAEWAFYAAARAQFEADFAKHDGAIVAQTRKDMCTRRFRTKTKTRDVLEFDKTVKTAAKIELDGAAKTVRYNPSTEAELRRVADGDVEVAGRIENHVGANVLFGRLPLDPDAEPRIHRRLSSLLVILRLEPQPTGLKNPNHAGTMPNGNVVYDVVEATACFNKYPASVVDPPPYVVGFANPVVSQKQYTAWAKADAQIREAKAKNATWVPKEQRAVTRSNPPSRRAQVPPG